MANSKQAIQKAEAEKKAKAAEAAETKKKVAEEAAAEKKAKAAEAAETKKKVAEEAAAEKKAKETEVKNAIMILRSKCASMALPDFSQDPAVFTHEVVRSCFKVIEDELAKG